MVNVHFVSAFEEFILPAPGKPVSEKLSTLLSSSAMVLKQRYASAIQEFRQKLSKCNDQCSRTDAMISCNYPVQICEQGVIQPLECSFAYLIQYKD